MHRKKKLDVLKNVRQIKSYDGMFHAIKALTVNKILKTRIANREFLQNESFSSSLHKCFDLDYLPIVCPMGFGRVSSQ